MKIAAKMPEYDFLVIGKAEEYDQKTIKHEAWLRKIAPNNVTFLGFVPVKNVLPSLDLTLHLSTVQEPFGRVILESLAFAVPVFATKNEILRGSLLKKFVISPRHPESIAKKIRGFFADKSLQKAFRYAAQKRAADFAIEKWAERIAETWEEVSRDKV